MTALRAILSVKPARLLNYAVRVRHEGVAVAVACYEGQCHLLYCQQSPTGTGVRQEV
jgi:hypothetical protein